MGALAAMTLPRVRQDGGRIALVVCGALVREVRELADRRGWQADFFGVHALYHLEPPRILASLERTLAALAARPYERVVVVYGDCGTVGAIDALCARYGAVHPAAPHCYAMFGGAVFERIVRERPATYFLTDWLVRNWPRAVEKGLRIDRYPRLQAAYFGRFTGLVWLRQQPATELEPQARQIAASLGLPLEIHDVGLGDLEPTLIGLVEGRPRSRSDRQASQWADEARVPPLQR